MSIKKKQTPEYTLVLKETETLPPLPFVIIWPGSDPEESENFLNRNQESVINIFREHAINPTKIDELDLCVDFKQLSDAEESYDKILKALSEIDDSE